MNRRGYFSSSYASACKTAGINLRKGYLFPPTTSPHHSSIRVAPLLSTVATKRLRLYLPDEDITAHGSCAGAAITLLMLSATKEAVMEHCRWALAKICRHYTKLERVRRLDLSARLLQAGVIVIRPCTCTNCWTKVFFKPPLCRSRQTNLIFILLFHLLSRSTMRVGVFAHVESG